MTTTPQLLTLARSQEIDEGMRHVAGQASLFGFDRHEWTEARLCDCTDNAHPYRPEPGDLREFTWTSDVAQVQAVRAFQGGAVHVRYRRRMALTAAETDIATTGEEEER